MKVLITGATGFIGSAVLEHFLESGIPVKALLRENSKELSSKVETAVADISHGTEIRPELFAGIDVVIHAAARAHIMNEESLNPLMEYRKVNTNGTLALARKAADSGVKRFVFVSSIKVNGEFTKPGEKFVERLAQPPTDPYAISKYEAEEGLLRIAENSDMEIVIVRPPLVYGLGVKGNFANMTNYLKKGVILPFGSVHNSRSLVALDNLVDFIALSADRERSSKARNEVFLVSDGEDVSTSKLLRKISSAYGVKARLLPIPVNLMRFVAKILGKGAILDRLFGSLQVDGSKARDLLGWKPLVTMDEQLAKMALEDLHSAQSGERN